MVSPSPFIQLLLDKQVSHVWRGHGSAVFLEFGQLSPMESLCREGSQPCGEATLMIQWSWRIERRRSILGGSWSSEGRWPTMLRQLVGSTVSTVEIFGALPEIAVSLSNGLRVVSFMTAEGQPEWSVISRKPALGNLCVRRGLLCVEACGPDQSFKRVR